MGDADYLALGDWNAQCYQCGCKRKASTMKRHWQGFWVCPNHWEPRQTQDFVKAVADKQVPHWTQPLPADQFVSICTLSGRSSIPGLAVPGCAIPGAVYYGLEMP